MYRKAVLDNGLRILTSAMPHTRSVGIGFFIGVGSRYEMDEQGGASHFIEHMLFKGTEKRPTAKDIAMAIEGIGGVFNASTGRETTVYYAKVAQPHLVVAMDVLVDMLLHAKFDPKEIEKERRVIIEEINMVLDIPDHWVHLLINELVWPDHPLGRDVAGTKESVNSLSRETLFAHLRQHYVPTNTVVSVAGNIDHEAMVEYIAACLNSWGEDATTAGERGSFQPAENGSTEPHLCVRYRDTEQAHLCLNVPGLAHAHPDRFNLRLLNTILGEGMSSRLFQEVREQQGLAYSINSYVNSFHDTGTMGVYAGVAPGRFEAAVKAILRELDRLRQEPVPVEELIKAKEFVKGRLLLQMEDTFSVAAWFGRQELLLPEILTVDDVVAAIDAVSADDVQRVAQELFHEEKLYLAVVGPFPEGGAEERASIEDDFKKLLQL